MMVGIRPAGAGTKSGDFGVFNTGPAGHRGQDDGAGRTAKASANPFQAMAAGDFPAASTATMLRTDKTAKQRNEMAYEPLRS